MSWEGFTEVSDILGSVLALESNHGENAQDPVIALCSPAPFLLLLSVCGEGWADRLVELRLSIQSPSQSSSERLALLLIPTRSPRLWQLT